MTNVQISITSFMAILLVMQCHPNQAFIPPASTSVSIENYVNQFLSSIKQATSASEESAKNVAKAISQLGQNISKEIEELHYSIDGFHISKDRKIFDSLMALQNHLGITNNNFKKSFGYYKTLKHGGSEQKLKQSILNFAQDILTGFHFSGLSRVEQLIDYEFLNKFTNVDSMCKMRESQQQFFEDMLKIIQYATAQSYATVDFAYELLKHLGDKTENLDYVQNVRSEVLNVYRDCAKKFKFHMENLSREFYTCDSIEGDTNSFIELKAFQKYLFTEDQISPGFPGQSDSCTKRCHAVNNMRSPIVCKKSTHKHAGRNNNDELCNDVSNCHNLHCPYREESYIQDYEICVNYLYNYFETHNRYEFYHPSSQSSDKHCSGYKQILGTTSRGGRYGGADGAFCGICDCICMDNNYYISTEAVTSNVTDHMVVVGAKFVLLKNTLYIQLRQAKLLPNGGINASTISWKEIEETEKNRVKIDWETMRRIDLTEHVLPEGEVLTGLRLSELNQGIGLSALSRTYNFEEGLLDLGAGFENGHTRQLKKELEVGSDKPTRNSGNRRLSKKDEYVMFNITSAMSDGGQSTVPFIDDREVIPQILTPLSGAGLIYMGQKGSGGYIGLKLTTYVSQINVE